MARTREFETEDAIEAVLNIFWRKGYADTSMSDLEAATGLKRQSLYRVFPDKRAIYLAALELYETVAVDAALVILNGAGDPVARLAKFLNEATKETRKSGERRGCFLCNASVDQVQHDAQVATIVNRMTIKLKNGLTSVIKEIPHFNDAEATKLAASILATYFGMRVMARANMKTRDLEAAAKIALSSLDAG